VSTDFVEGSQFGRARTISEEYVCPEHGFLDAKISISYTSNSADGPVKNEHVYCPACLCKFLDSLIAAGVMKKITKRVTTR